MTRTEIIQAHVQKLIESLPVNARLPTEHELMSQFGVARQTVNGVMKKLADQGLVFRRARAGTFVGSSVPVFSHAENTAQHLKRVIIAYPNWFSFDYWQKVLFAERAIIRRGYVPLHFRLEPGEDMAAIKESVGRVPLQDAVAGIFVIPPGSALENNELTTLDNFGIRTVITVPVEGIRRFKNLYTVANDFELCGRMAVEILVKHGHRSFGYIQSEPSSDSNLRLKKGMRAALNEAGLSPRSLHAPRVRMPLWTYTPQQAYDAAVKLLRKRPTAILVDSRVGMMAVVRACYDHDVKVPEDVSLVVFDDHGSDHDFLIPRPCLIAAPREEVVRGAINVIFSENPLRETLIAPSVEFGESVSVAPATTGLLARRNALITTR